MKKEGIVEHIRINRDKINIDLEDLTPEEHSEYFKKMRYKSCLNVKP